MREWILAPPFLEVLRSITSHKPHSTSGLGFWTVKWRSYRIFFDVKKKSKGNKRHMNYNMRSSAAVAAKSLQSCPTLCDPIDGSPPGSPTPGILQARTLEWVAISFSNAGKWKVKVKSLSHVRLFATPWTAAYQAPPSMGFSRQECWSGMPLPSPKRSSTDVNFLSGLYTYLLTPVNC